MAELYICLSSKKNREEEQQDVENRILELMKTFRLVYGSFDFIVGKDDKLIFLEINPTGNWDFIEDATGMPITEAVTNIIMKETTTLSSTKVTLLS
jgi:glutathione synthase/RimK-type ligase-like ATP-grasp enzyme